MIEVSVLIPTFRRPQSFLRAARSVLSQRGAPSFELIAVDNSPEGSALAAFETLTGETEAPFRWVHEPRPGVAHARNAALALARGRLVAWLDDDEEACPDWLAALVAVRRETGAQSVFGPVRARAHESDHAAFFERLYSRSGPAKNAKTEHSYGIGNSLQPRAMFDEAETFDPRANETGGEDDALFASWREAGATFAWAADAQVTEHLEASRMRLTHGFRRAFAYGQGPCETAWAQRQPLQLLRHMSVGAAQAASYGVAGAIVLAGSTPLALQLFDRAARGAGKVFWFCEQRFYGDTLARKAA